MLRLQRVTFVATMAVVASRAAGAQKKLDDGDVAHRNQCSRAAAAVAKGHPEKDNANWFHFIARCDQSGAPALASVWSALPSDTAILNSLYLASARVKDARLYLTLRSVATNRGAPPATRVASLRTLARLVRPNAEPSLEAMRPPLDPTKRLQTSIVDHFDQYAGTVPLPATYADDIRGLMKELSTDPDVSVRAAAFYLSKAVLAYP